MKITGLKTLHQILIGFRILIMTLGLILILNSITKAKPAKDIQKAKHSPNEPRAFKQTQRTHHNHNSSCGSMWPIVSQYWAKIEPKIVLEGEKVRVGGRGGQIGGGGYMALAMTSVVKWLSMSKPHCFFE
jgi:hypothetical protein